MATAPAVAHHRRRTTNRAHLLQNVLVCASWRTRGQSMRGPMPDSRAGSKVLTTKMDTSGMSMPPMPVLRSPGTGSTMSAIRPMATVNPDSTTARPAVSAAAITASAGSRPRARSSRQRVTMQQ